ncbi:hypothetical protein Tco_0102719 [Tanacetum coccineum]
MVVLESCPKHNMVAYLEKTDGNAEFHEIIDFLTRSSIHYALIISHVVFTTFVEQFWMSAKSKTINNIRYIHATITGKLVTILEASIRSDLLFDDADGIYVLNNQAIFDTIQLMGFISIFLGNQLKNVPVPLDHFLVTALTSKVFSFMVKKGKHFSRKVTPMFPTMLVQPTKDEGEVSERQSEPQPTPSPPHPSKAQSEPQTDLSPRPSPSIPIPDPIPESSGGNQGGQSSSDRSLSRNEDGLTLQSVYDLFLSLYTQVTSQAKEIKALKAHLKKFRRKARPSISHHKAWVKSVKMKQRLARKKSLKKKRMQKESVSKQGRKSAKAEPSVHKDQAFDDLDDFDVMDYVETDAYNEKGVSTEPKVSIDKPDEGTDKPNEGTDSTKLSTDKVEKGIAEPEDNEPKKILLNMSQAKAVSKEKEKGVELKDVENIERPSPTSTRLMLTLKPLPKIDLKDKGKKVLEEEAESDVESEGVNEAEKKFKQMANDEEVARKVQEEWEAEEQKKRLAEEKASKIALSNEYDFIQARIEADRLLTKRIQGEEREQFIVEERAKFLHDTIAA